MEQTGHTDVTAPPGANDVTFSRLFDAPQELVYRALTDPELIPRWWGPASLTTTVDKMEVEPGGRWRYVQRSPEGEEYAFNGVYREVVPSERLTYTFNFEGMPGQESIQTVTLEQQDGKTKVTDRVHFQTVEERDGALGSGMEEGANESMERFAKLVDEMKAQ